MQDVIKRMATNSFQVKAWLIGILSALMVFEKDTIFGDGAGSRDLALIMNWFLFLPILCFWYLDAFFLSTEKLYRELYKWIVNNRPHTDKYLYDLNTFKREVEGKTEHLLLDKNNLWNVLISKTLWPFYAMPLAFVVALLFYNYWRQ
ncbi:MAG: hypothetical protein L6Q97_05650 [Thermoanaerobaculia bacterium]|nr:hypothetical protein [Thermoanaerobaculia bacterium]